MRVRTCKKCVTGKQPLVCVSVQPIALIEYDFIQVSTPLPFFAPSFGLNCQQLRCKLIVKTSYPSLPVSLYIVGMIASLLTGRLVASCFNKL